jgi:hypothetical protein
MGFEKEEVSKYKESVKNGSLYRNSANTNLFVHRKKQQLLNISRNEVTQ